MEDDRQKVMVFIQARMSSKRFPGKVLAPLKGAPIIDHVVDRVSRAMPLNNIVIATSDDHSDDPLAWYLEKNGVAVFRGPLNNVVLRFQLCLYRYPCDWFFRVSADSPYLDSSLFPVIGSKAGSDDVDIVTNVFPRSYPGGQSLELIRASRFAALKSEDMSPAEQEHVTLFFYGNPETFKIVNVKSAGKSFVEQSYAVDTVEDLRRLEGLMSDSL